MAAAVRGPAAHRGASRVLDILEFLGESPDGFTLAGLSRRLRVPKSSLLALLRVFVERGYLERQAAGVYGVGRRAHDIGLRAPFRPGLSAFAAPALRELAEKTGESAFLGAFVRNPPEVVYVDKVESPQRIRYSAELGERRPLHCTAPGLAVLAFLPDAEREALVETLELERFTFRTVTDRRLLRARLAEIQRAGVAVNVDEFIAGASGIASPVFDHARVPVGTCSVIGPTSRLVVRKDRIARWVKRAAAGVSRQLGFVPARRGWPPTP
jgi:IclR family transcriptional regulator, acetate operon repressor